MMSDNPSQPIALEDRVRDAAKLYSPSAARNKDPIAAVLDPRLAEGATVLEIGSGTGEHGETVCLRRGDVRWHMSEIDPDSRASCAARASETDGLLPPIEVDAASADWNAFGSVDVLACLNVIHIAPWRVAEGLAAGAEKIVGADGFVFLYGPFKDGDFTAPSNLEFDASLKTRNPEWGVRDLGAVCDLFKRHGFALDERIDMPSNNLSLIFRRRG